MLKSHSRSIISEHFRAFCTSSTLALRRIRYKKYILSIVLLVLLLMPTALAAGDVKINDFSANITHGTIKINF
jgi:hypothetical protein